MQLNLEKRADRDWSKFIKQQSKTIKQKYQKQKIKKNPVMFFEEIVYAEQNPELKITDIKTAQSFLKFNGEIPKLKKYIINLAQEKFLDCIRAEFLN